MPFPRILSAPGLSAEAKKQLNIRGGNYFCPGLFRALLTAKNLKAVHLHTGGLIGAMGRLAAKLRGVPYVISIHGGQADLPKEQMDQLLAPLQGTFNWGKILEILLRTNRVHADADAIISLGESERRKLKEQYPHTRVEVLPNGVDYRRFASADGAAFRKKYRLGNGPLILCVGSFHRQKNQMTLFEAFAGLRKTSMPDVKLVLIGVVYDEAYRGTSLHPFSFCPAGGKRAENRRSLFVGSNHGKTPEFLPEALIQDYAIRHPIQRREASPVESRN